MPFGPILFILFTVVPVIEIVLFLLVGQQIGILPTIGIIFLTALAGSYLVARQGTAQIRRVRFAMQQGEFPGADLVDGALILVAGALLLTPGFLTDTIGFLLLAPPVRDVLRRLGGGYMRRRTQFL